MDSLSHHEPSQDQPLTCREERRPPRAPSQSSGPTARRRADGPQPESLRTRAVAALAESARLRMRPHEPSLALPARVLIIDDDDDLLQLARGILGADGYLVDVAYSGLDGVHKALRFPPDVILLDVLMTGCDALEVFDTLRQHERTAAVPVLALSTLAGRDAARLLLDIGFAALIAKPVDWPVLRHELRRRAGCRTR